MDIFRFCVYKKDCSAISHCSCFLLNQSPHSKGPVCKKLSLNLQQFWLTFFQKVIFSTTIIQTCLEVFLVFFKLLWVMSPRTRTVCWDRPPVEYWSCCWVTQRIMVRLLVIDFQRARSHFPTMDVIIYSASVSSLAFIFLDSCLLPCFLCSCSTFKSEGGHGFNCLLSTIFKM